MGAINILSTKQFYCGNNNKNCISNRQYAFTLIEVLIALVILAIALTAIVKITADNVNNTITIKNYIIARQVAVNTIKYAQLGLIPLPELNSNEQSTIKMLKSDWFVNIALTNTKNKHINNITVAVSDEKAAKPIIELSGFILHE